MIVLLMLGTISKHSTGEAQDKPDSALASADCIQFVARLTAGWVKIEGWGAGRPSAGAWTVSSSLSLSQHDRTHCTVHWPVFIITSIIRKHLTDSSSADPQPPPDQVSHLGLLTTHFYSLSRYKNVVASCGTKHLLFAFIKLFPLSIKYFFFLILTSKKTCSVGNV